VGERFVWLAPGVINRLKAMRGSGESFSDVILRLVELETERRPVPTSRPRGR
jgi:predicted CopG family antitoxin